MRFPFIGPTYESSSLNADASRAVNLYLEMVESGTGKNKAVLYGTPGLQLYATVGTGPIRALWAGQNRLFAVSGTILYEISEGGGVTHRGPVGTNDGYPARIFPNGHQLFIVAGNMGFIDDGIAAEDGTMVHPAPVPAADIVGSEGTPAGTVGTARSGCYLDGYFIASKPDTNVFYISNLLDGMNWNPNNTEETPDDPSISAEFGRKEGYPDAIEMVLADHEELWLFGSQSIEVWRNTGAADFPFQRDPGAYIHHGVIAPFTVGSIAGTVCWLGGDARGGPVAYRAQGFQPERISNHAIEDKWRLYPVVSDANAFGYTLDGHMFWQLNFPTANATWVWDAVTGMWHERSSGGINNRHRAMAHAQCFGKNLVGDWANGNIYAQNSFYYTDAGQTITRVRSAPHISNEQLNQAFHAFQLDLQVEDGTPEVTLDWSDDGGHTWNNPRTTVPSVQGHAGRVIFRRLGKSRDRVFRVSIEDPVKVALIDAYLRMTPGFA